MSTRAVSTTCVDIERPPMACSTFGNLERMRVPCPAAMMTTLRFMMTTLLFAYTKITIRQGTRRTDPAPRPALIIAQCEPDPRPPQCCLVVSLFLVFAYVLEQLLCRGVARCVCTFQEPLRLVKGRGVLARDLEQPGRLGLEPRDGREVTGMVGGV